MEEKILIFGHKNPDTDTICSSMVKERFNKKTGCKFPKAVRLGNINKETQYVLNYLGLEAPELIENIEEGQKVILVDHNEFGQSVNGIEKAKIMGVVDHHRIANFETSEPLYYLAKPYGCTSTILYQEYKHRNFEISKEEAILMKEKIQEFLEKKLKLSLNKKTNYFKNKQGVSFCGYHVYNNKIVLLNQNKKKIYKKVRNWNYLYSKGELDLFEAAQSLIAWIGHASAADSYEYIEKIKKKCDWYYKGEIT